MLSTMDKQTRLGLLSDSPGSWCPLNAPSIQSKMLQRYPFKLYMLFCANGAQLKAELSIQV